MQNLLQGLTIGRTSRLKRGIYLLLSTLLITLMLPGAKTRDWLRLVVLKRCANCNLTWVELRRINLSGADLRNTDLSGAILDSVNLTNADLSGANLQGARLHNVTMKNTRLCGTLMTNAVKSSSCPSAPDLSLSRLGQQKQQGTID